MDYRLCLARMHEILAPLTYLEIGVWRGATLGLATGRAVGIDPRPQLAPEFLSDRPLTRVYETTSDDFFATQTPESAFLGMPVEMAFIDGLHTFEQVLRDFINVERWMSRRGVIVVHDVLPKDIAWTSRKPTGGPWCGDVWRLREFLAEHRPDLTCSLVPAEPSGLLVTAGVDPQCPWTVSEALSLSKGTEPASDFDYEAAFRAYVTDVEVETPDDFLSRFSLPMSPVVRLTGARRPADGAPFSGQCTSVGFEERREIPGRADRGRLATGPRCTELARQSASELGLSLDQVMQLVGVDRGPYPELRHPLLPIAMVRQALVERRRRWAEGAEPATALEASDGDEEQTIRRLLAMVAGEASDPATTRMERLRAADEVIEAHCLNEWDALRLGAHREHPVLRALSDLAPLPVFTSNPSRDPGRLGKRGNPGDAFAVPVAAYLAGRQVAPRGTWAEPDEPLLFTVGSVLQSVRDRGVVWGVGAIMPLRQLRDPEPTGSLMLGVRGPRTRDEVVLRWQRNPAVVGDPGLLLPDVFPSEVVEPDVEVGILAHEVDRVDIGNLFPEGFHIRNYEGFAALIADLSRCRSVVSTSLHGMIFAHAMGKPVALLDVAGRLTGDDFKFSDYLCSLGIYAEKPRSAPADVGKAPLWSPCAEAVDSVRTRLTTCFPL